MNILIIAIGFIIFCMVFLTSVQRHKGAVVVRSLVDSSLNAAVTTAIAVEVGQQALLDSVSPKLGSMTPAERLAHLEALNALPVVTENPEA